MENECEALPGVAYPGVRDNRSTFNTKTGYDDDNDDRIDSRQSQHVMRYIGGGCSLCSAASDLLET